MADYVSRPFYLVLTVVPTPKLYYYLVRTFCFIYRRFGSILQGLETYEMLWATLGRFTCRAWLKAMTLSPTVSLLPPSERSFYFVVCLIPCVSYCQESVWIYLHRRTSS